MNLLPEVVPQLFAPDNKSDQSMLKPNSQIDQSESEPLDATDVMNQSFSFGQDRKASKLNNMSES